MKRISFLLVFMAFLSCSAPACGMDALFSAIEQKNPLQSFFAKDTENLLAVAKSGDINEQKALFDLEKAINAYVSSLPDQLQKTLNWSEQFTVFKKRLEKIKPYIYYYGNQQIARGSYELSDAEYEYVLTFLGLKPISTVGLDNGTYKLDCPGYYPLYNSGQDKRFFVHENENILFNSAPVFPYTFIYECYKNSIKCSDRFIDDMYNNALYKKNCLEYWVREFIKGDIAEDDAACTLGLVPTVFAKRADIVRNKVKAWFEANPISDQVQLHDEMELTLYDTFSAALDVDMFLNNENDFRLLGLPGKAILGEQTAYTVLYSALIEYMWRASMSTKTYLNLIVSKIFELFNHPAIKSEYTTQLCKGTSITDIAHYVEKSLKNEVSEQEYLQCAVNFLESIAK